MAFYKPPKGDSILFNFSDAGYEAPDFLNINFKSIFDSTSDLQASIEILQLYNDSTYTFVKSCRKVITGYTSNGIQILHLPCSFGGIRDITGYINATTSDTDFADLSSELKVVQRSFIDLYAKLRVTGFGFLDLYSYIRGFASSDLEAEVKILYRSSGDLSTLLSPILPYDLTAVLNVIEVRDLYTYIRGFSFSDLGSRVNTLYRNSFNLAGSVSPIPPYDLSSILNVIEVRDLYSYIRGFEFRDLESRTKVLYRSSTTLSSFLSPILPYDLASILNVIEIRDLYAYIRPHGFVDLEGVVNTLYRNSLDLSSLLSPILPSNLEALLNIIEIRNLYGYIRGFTFCDLGTSIKSLYKSNTDLSTLLSPILPYNLTAILNVIEIRDLLSSIEGIYFKGSSDLPTEFDRVTFKSRINLLSNIVGWGKVNLTAYIRPAHYFDLYGSIFGGNYKVYRNIAAYLYSIPPKDLYAYLHGYDTSNLGAFSIVGYQPNDLPASLNVVIPGNIRAYIYGMVAQNVFFNLGANIHGYRIEDLNAYISSISAKNLSAFIVATGKYLDLIALIVPKTINIKRILSVSLYEHKNLRATINYNCLKSNFKDLLVSIYSIKKLDLKAYIIGWFGDKARNVLDLRAYINSANYEELDFSTVNANMYSCAPQFVTHKISFNPSNDKYKVFDTHIISGLSSAHMLTAYITGILQSRDLSCTIDAKPIANFTTAPSWVNPKTYEVIINLNRFEERWYRFVELMFFTNSSSEYNFFYVPEEDKVYKVERDRTWKVQVLGFSDDPDNIYSRVKINKKLLFKLSNYATFDDALRDFIDRVSLSRSVDLEAMVSCYTYPHYDINATIRIIKRKTWSLSCKATIKSMQRNLLDFSATIAPEIYHGTNNLTALIVGKHYEPPDPNNIEFIFDIGTYVSPGSYNNMNWTYIQAENFWKDN